MPIVVGGVQYAQIDAEHPCRNWLSHPTLIKRNTAHMNTRTRFCRAVMLHTVHGTADGGIVEQEYAPGEDPSSADLTYTKYQATTTREVSWHFTVDTDGSIAQAYDPATEVCWHGNQCNPYALGIELVQAKDGDLTRGQLKALVALLDLLTGVSHPKMAIPRQTFVRADNAMLYRGIIPATLTENGSGSKVCGIYGHRNVGYRASNGKIMGYRGAGDPGDAPFDTLYLLYDRVKLASDADLLEPWKTRQAGMGVKSPDGIYGPETRELVRKALGNKSGQFVPRPIDALLNG